MISRKTEKRSESRQKRRAQLLSVDFLVAVSILTVCIGTMLQFNEFFHSRAELAAFLADNKAEAIAALLHDGNDVPPNVAYCARRVLLTQEIQNVQGAGNCATFSCDRGVFSARRLESCKSEETGNTVACVLEVRAC